MTKFQEAIGTYTSFMSDKLGMTDINEGTLVALAQMLGDNIFDRDAALVACSDKNELKTVKELFLIKELGLTEDKKAFDEAIKAVCTEMGASNRKKFRVVFYYLLLNKLGQTFPIVAKKATAKVETKPTVKVETKATAKTETRTAVRKTVVSDAVSDVVAQPTVQKAKIKTPEATTPDTLTFDEEVENYKVFVSQIVNFDEVQHDLFVGLTQYVGFKGFKSELSVIDVTDEREFHNIKNNFIKGRLDFDNDHEAAEAIYAVGARMGNLTAYRVPFYYLLTKHLGREWAILERVEATLY